MRRLPTFAVLTLATYGTAQPYDAAEVRGIEELEIPASARAKLLEDGFVATDSRSLNGGAPWLQIYQAYRPGDHPHFLTTDALIDWYTFNLDRMVADAWRSRRTVWVRLLSRLREVASSTDGAYALVEIASVALAVLGEPIPTGAGSERIARTAAALLRGDDDVVVVPGQSAVPTWMARDARGEVEALRVVRSMLQDASFDTSDDGRRAHRTWQACRRDAELSRLLGALSAPWDALVGPRDGEQPSRSVLCAHENPFSTLLERANATGRDMTGLHILASGPLRSDSGLRALQLSRRPPLGETLASWPSVHGRWLDALRELQATDPRAATVFHTESFALKQAATQLAAWACTRHAFRSHALRVTLLRADPPEMRVSPYPGFFRALARCCEELLAWRDTVSDGRTDTERAADVRQMIDLAGRRRRLPEIRGLTQAQVRTLGAEQNRLLRICLGRATTRQSWMRLVEVAAAPADASDADREAWGWYRRGLAGIRIEELSSVSAQLAEIADAQLSGRRLSEAQRELLLAMPAMLAMAREYGNEHTTPDDDHGVVAPVASAPGVGHLHVGVTRPLALLVILPIDDVPTVHVGAMLNYREFVRLTEVGTKSWRDEIAAERTPPPPRFFSEFYR